MSPKEKAIELINYYRTIIRKADVYNNLNVFDEIDLSKQSTLIMINEIFKITSFYNDTHAENNYWNEVKHEIEQL